MITLWFRFIISLFYELSSCSSDHQSTPQPLIYSSTLYRLLIHAHCLLGPTSFTWCEISEVHPCYCRKWWSDLFITDQKSMAWMNCSCLSVPMLTSSHWHVVRLLTAILPVWLCGLLTGFWCSFVSVINSLPASSLTVVNHE